MKTTQSRLTLTTDRTQAVQVTTPEIQVSEASSRTRNFWTLPLGVVGTSSTTFRLSGRQSFESPRPMR